MSGPPPTPTRLRMLRGNPGHRPLNRNEPEFTAEIPNCPPHLDAVAREEWERMAPQLLKLRLLTTADRAAFAAYCQSYSTWTEAQLLIARAGLIVKVNERWNAETKRMEGGSPAVNPLVKVAESSLGLMLKFLAEFGLTPASRTRVTAAPEAVNNPFTKFKKRA